MQTWVLRSPANIWVPLRCHPLFGDDAIVAMVDANIQREELLPSEKAFAYKMKLEAMKRQGVRTDLTLSQNETKLRSDEVLSKQVGESRAQVQRFVRLTELIPELLDLVDKGAWTTELADEQTEEAEEYHIDVRYNMDTDELIDVKERMEQPIDTNLSVMGQAEQLINQLEAEKNIFTSEERNLIVNYAYKLDDMNKTRELAEKLAYREQYAQQDVALTIIDAKAEIDALPDPMIGLSEMREYGYQWDEMLPLTQEKALELFEHDLPVYLLHTDGAESLAESRERIEEHEGIFGVEKETWNKALKQQTKITLILMDEQEREYTYPYPVVAVDIEEMGGDRTAVFKTSEPISDTDVAEIHNAFYGTDLEFEIEKELGITWVESINYEDGSVITPEMARKEQLLYASTDKYGILYIHIIPFSYQHHNKILCTDNLVEQF